MDDRSPVKGQFDGLPIGDQVQQQGLFEIPGVGVEHPRDILPYGHGFRIQAIGEDRSEERRVGKEWRWRRSSSPEHTNLNRSLMAMPGIVRARKGVVYGKTSNIEETR